MTATILRMLHHPIYAGAYSHGHQLGEDKPLPATSTLSSCLPRTEAQKKALRSRLITTAPLARQPIAKGLAGPGLLAYVITSKYADHLPLHRLEGIIACQGVEISRQTMSD